MTTPTPPRRRWFSYSLRTFFVVLMIFGVWLGWNVHRVRQRESLLQFLAANGAGTYTPAQVPIKPWKSLPWVWAWLGAKPVGAIQVRKTLFSDSDRQYLEELFPEASVVTEN